MAEEITALDSPIDAMALIHKALVAEGSRVQDLIEGCICSGGLGVIEHIGHCRLLYYASESINKR